MSKASVKGTLTTKTVMVPIIWDSPGFDIPVKDTSVQTALKSFDWTADVLGFQFSQSVRCKLISDADGSEIKFSRRHENPDKYLFATKVLGGDEVAALRTGQGALSDAFNRLPEAQRSNPANVVYDSDIGLQVLKPEYQGNTILITKQGQQLFPRPAG